MINFYNPCSVVRRHPIVTGVVALVISAIVLLIYATADSVRGFSDFIRENYKLYTYLGAIFYICVCLEDLILLRILKKWTILKEIIIWKYNTFSILLLVICFITIYCTDSEIVSPNVKYCIGSVLLSIFFTCLQQQHGYSDSDVNSYLKVEDSIGGYWARGAYLAFYELVLKDIKERISQFEKEEYVKFYVKKLVLVIPASCDVRNTLAEKDAKMEYVKDLKLVICDQGANMNREYKNPVYKISDDGENVYIAVESPSCLRTLWILRDEMEEVIWKYHRDCFVEELRFLVRDSPCMVLEYDGKYSFLFLKKIPVSLLINKIFIHKSMDQYILVIYGEKYITYLTSLGP